MHVIAIILPMPAVCIKIFVKFAPKLVHFTFVVLAYTTSEFKK